MNRLLPFLGRGKSYVDLLGVAAQRGSIVRAGDTATYIDANGVLQDAVANTLRYDYSNPNGAGWLIESAVTVEGRSGEDLRTNAEGNPLSVWTEGNCPATRDQLAPDGTLTASRLYASGGNAVHSRNMSTATASGSGQSHAISLFAKAAELNTLVFGFVSGGGYSFATFTLSGAGSVGVVTNNTNWSAGAGSIRYVGGGWYLLKFTAVNSGTSVSARIYPGGSPAYDNNNAGIIAWGFDVALNSAVTGSYVRNADLQVTRAADDVSLLLSNVPRWNANAGTIVADFVAGPDVASRYLFEISNGTTANRLRIFTTSLGVLGFWVTAASVTHTQIYSSVALIPFSRNHVTISFKANEFYISVNGASLGSSLSGAMPTGLSIIQFGTDRAKTSSAFIGGHLARMSLLPKAYGTAIRNM